jgi:hypothetical protein
VSSTANRFIKVCQFLIIFGSLMFLSAIILSSIPSREKLIWILMFGIYITCYWSVKLSIWKTSFESSIAVIHDTVENLALLSEQGTILIEWKLVNRNGIVIGKNTEKEKVDIDLSKTSDAPFISRKHAVLNFSSGNWYVEDLDSRNGIRVKKPGKESVNIKGSGPVLLERGDMFYISNTAFVLR